MRTLLLLPFLAACSVYPAFVAKKVVELEIPAATLQSLACESHNGAIVVTGAVTETIKLRCEMSVRGVTQEEADGNLALLDLGREATDTQLKLFGRYPRAELQNRSPSFAFTMTAPAKLALQLTTHNGDVTTNGISGPVAVTTHNGRIDGQVDGAQVTATTHNGDIALQVGGSGNFEGAIETHNGDVQLVFAGARNAAIEASTHNGRLTATGAAAVVEARRSSLRANVGTGGGKLVVTTHNGDVTVR